MTALSLQSGIITHPHKERPLDGIFGENKVSGGLEKGSPELCLYIPPNVVNVL